MNAHYSRLKRDVLIAGILLVLVGAGLIWKREDKGNAAPVDKAAAAEGAASANTRSSDAERPIAARGAPQWQFPVRSEAETKALQARAEAGDAAAQRELAWAYDRCWIMSLDPAGYPRQIHVMASLLPSPRAAAIIEQAGRALMKECAGLDDGQRIPMDAITLWMQQAARGGDLEAIAMTWRPNNTHALEQETLWDRVIAEGNAEALHALINVYQAEEINRRFGDVLTRDDASSALLLAACRLGKDCGPGSVFMRTMCTAAGACADASYETFLMGQLPVAEREVLQRQVEAVLQKLQRKGWASTVPLLP
ncbi:hypothetical protein RZA67_03480 [Stenotrophomonas sp. C3(2023)]|uniref:hypothetical protein n=1 Tax=Stenotrophomonas sp. C3(2023) TaxID=3080277 RepID=UPI00293CDB4B|nr:hypothetical protein [Stenotrophomonas sp. C3(2023)]MDV3467793.1 hypothetical protein [Stenotrophomonas sp. C3(2023)]